MRQAERIAAEFRVQLLLKIGGAKYDEARRRNAIEPSASVCHTHDFCDANEVMAAAFRKVKGYAPLDDGHRAPEDDGITDADLALWEEAWDIWKRDGPVVEFWAASLDTSHYSFAAYGATEDAARIAMRRTWEQHRAQRWPNVAPWRDVADDVNVSRVRLGAGYRDHAEIVKG